VRRRPFDLRNRDTGLPQEVSERVEPLALGPASPKRAVQWREGDPVHGVDGVDVAPDPSQYGWLRGARNHLQSNRSLAFRFEITA